MKKIWHAITKDEGRVGQSSTVSPRARNISIAYPSFAAHRDRTKSIDNIAALSKLHMAAWKGDLNTVIELAKEDPNPLDKELNR